MGDGALITLKDIWLIENPKDYKIHFGFDGNGPGQEQTHSIAPISSR